MSVLNLKLISDPSRFRAGLQKASKELKGFAGVARSTANTMNRALGAAGIGIGLRQMTMYLKDAGKAAALDTVSQKQLALALRNTIGANSVAIQASEQYIQKLSNTVAILDDDLRPALATAVRATGSLTKAQDLLSVAIDVSAGTGKDLTTVVKAIARAQNGQLGGLQRLIPSIKKGSDFMAQLRKQFKGAAQAAAENNPYQSLNVLLDNLKETIGAKLLPGVQKFTKSLRSPEGQKTLDKVATLLGDIGKSFISLTSFIASNIALVKSLAAAFITVKLSIGAMTLAMRIYDITTKAAAISTKALRVAIATTGIGALVVLVATLAENWGLVDEKQNAYFKHLQEHSTKDIGGTKIMGTGRAWLPRALGLDKPDASKPVVKGVKKVIETTKDAIKSGITELANTGKQFRETIGLSLGVFGQDEYSIFNMDVLMAKAKRMVDAARGFTQNIKKLVKAGAGQDVVNELISMGPAQGNIVAKGLLSSGQLSEYLGLRQSLYKTGMQVAGQAQQAPTNYTFNIKSNMSAQDIVNLIHRYEKKTGRRYLNN